MTNHSSKRPNLLCIVPPYATDCAPAGAASLLGFLDEQGCRDFDFVDLRLYSPPRYAPTYRPFGRNHESYVIDLPDLPLVLELLRAHRRGEIWPQRMSPDFEQFCEQRDIDAAALFGYLRRMGAFLDAAVAHLQPAQLVGFSTWTSNYLTTLMAAARLKRLDEPPAIIAGGPQVTESRGSAHLALRAGLFDLVVNGEGEYSLLEAYEELLSFSVEPFVATPNQPLLENPESVGLSVQPWPDRVIDIAPYFADITTKLACTVRGDGQTEARVRGLKRANKLHRSAYSWPSRLGAGDLPRWVDIAPSWSLLVTHGPDAERKAWLADDAEREQLRGKEADPQAVAGLLNSRHLVPPRGIEQARTPCPLHGEAVRLNPLCIARRVDERLLVVCCASGAGAYLPRAAAPLIEALDSSWIQRCNLTTIDSSLSHDPSVVHEFIDRLARRGLVMHRQMPPDRSETPSKSATPPPSIGVH